MGHREQKARVASDYFLLVSWGRKAVGRLVPEPLIQSLFLGTLFCHPLGPQCANS